MKRTTILAALCLAVLAVLAGCTTRHTPPASADELDRAARTGVIPEHWRPVDRQAAEILRQAKIEGGAL